MLKTHIHKLKNNLSLALTPMKETEIIACNMWVKTGSRNEKLAENGISHFLEHMAFKGTKKRTAKEIALEFDNIGGHLNAGTSREKTIYYTTILKEHIDLSLDVLSDILQNSVFDETEIEKERNVILQEIAMYNDMPDDVVNENFQMAMYGDQPIARPILGPEANVNSFKKQDFINYMNRQYSTDNMLLTIAGNFNIEEITEKCENYFANLNTKNQYLNEKAHYKGGFSLEEQDIEQSHIMLGFDGFEYLSDYNYPTHLLAVILGGGTSSRLFQEIRENLGLCYSIASFSTNYSDTGNFAIYAATEPNKTKELILATNNIIKDISQKINDDELIRAKNQVIASLKMSQERSSYKADEAAKQIMCRGKLLSSNDLIKKINDVSLEDLYLSGKKLLSSKPTLAILGPNAKNYEDIYDDCQEFYTKIAHN